MDDPHTVEVVLIAFKGSMPNWLAIDNAEPVCLGCFSGI